MCFLYGKTFNNVRNKNGLLTAILSYRDKLLINETIPFIDNNWLIVNYFFGGINDISTRSQMGFLDLFYFFGLIGTTIYLYSFRCWFFNFKLSRINIYFILILFFITFLSGNFFLNASIPIYMVILNKRLKKPI